MKSHQLLLIAIVASFLFLRCTKQKEQIRYEELKLTELFNYFMNTSDSIEEQKLIHFLNDSIVKHPNGYFSIFENLDSIENQLKLVYPFCPDATHLDVKVKRRNVFIINIDRYNKITVNWKNISDSKHLKNHFIDFLENQNNIDSLSEKIIKDLPHLGTIYISKGAFVINTRLIPDNNSNRTSWKLVKKNINAILLVIHHLRAISSLQYFDTDFSTLNTSQQESICSLHPIRILIHPNRSERKITPPPPISKNMLNYLLDLVDKNTDSLQIN
ncbi:hypothetical protein [Marinifilum flexuosum]|uniref:hypothetical protein n=1 Tax=Marinifilum flexuosum TaxID=1117708 RepID=UPI002494DF12|nr:hypothetical protein [Marinifilum flexuosum]